MSTLTSLWFEKYRPTNLSEYQFQNDEHRSIIDKMCAEQSIPHLLLSGLPGTGKTTLARILMDVVNVQAADRLIINASADRGIEMFREKVTGFASTVALESGFKIVLLEEADRITPAAQEAMRVFMEEMADNIRVIMTCNDETKIVPAIKSRVQHLRFNAGSKEDILMRCAYILQEEKIKATIDDLEEYVEKTYPDMRQTINLLQLRSMSGTLLPFPAEERSSHEYIVKIVDALHDGNWRLAREFVLANVSSDNWADFYRGLYVEIEHSPKYAKQTKQVDEIITIIAEHMYKHAFVADSEINAAACLIKIATVK